MHPPLRLVNPHSATPTTPTPGRPPTLLYRTPECVFLCYAPPSCACDVCTFPWVTLQVHRSQGHGLFEKPLPRICWHSSAPLRLPVLFTPLCFFRRAARAPSPPPLVSHLSITRAPFGLPLSPSLATGMLTGTVYDKIEDEVPTSLVCAKHRRSFRLSFIILDQKYCCDTETQIQDCSPPKCAGLFMKGYDTFTAITEQVSCPNRPKGERGKND